jgi:hypothetical protein
VSALARELTQAIIPALRTITLAGLVLAGIAQVAFAMALMRWYRLGPETRARLARAVSLADVAVVVVVLLITSVAFRMNHGDYYWRVHVIIGQCLVTAAATFAIYASAVSAALRRRALLAGLALTVVTFVGLTAPGVRLSTSQRPAEVTRTVVHFSSLPAGLEGLRILLVGDTHVGRHITAMNMSARMRPLRRIEADLVVFIGDLATGGPGDMELAVKLVDGAVPRPLRFAVLGNHDQRIGADKVAIELVAHGFRVLRDEGQAVQIGHSRLWIAGITNSYNQPGDIAAALKGMPEDAFVLLLAHSPDVLLEPLAQRADLILAGHTHGGQVLLPLTGPMACSSGVGPRYAYGLFDTGHAQLFVTRGLGEVVTPFRILCEPEIAVLELRRADSHDWK